MEFERVLHLIQKSRNNSLPGDKAHRRMMALEIRKQIFKDVAYDRPPRNSAVLALIYPDQAQQARIIFILRKTYNGHHSGQISFPGGKQEVFDAGLIATALRETEEEIGVLPELIHIVRSLSPVFIPISNFKVQPYLAVANQPLNFVKDPTEVEQILSLYVEQILYNDLIDINHTYFGKNYNLKAFQVENIKIWGATAMILSEIVCLLRGKK